MLSGLKNFFIAFLISLVVCGLGAYFLISYVTAEFAPPADTAPTGVDGEPIPAPDDEMLENYRLTALIVGIDNAESQPGREADAIMLIDINGWDRTFRLSYLPRDMRVDVSGYTLRLGAVYAEHGAEMLARAVRANTGVQPDFFCVIDYGSIIALFDILGRIYYNVPVHMHHVPRPYNYFELSREQRAALVPEISLQAGMQRLDGAQVVQLLRFRGYGGSHIEDEVHREERHRSFLHEFISQKLTFENLSRAREIYDAVIGGVVATNMTSEDFEKFAGLIFGFARDFEFSEVIYPGTRSYIDGVYFFLPNHAAAMDAFSSFRR